MTALHLIGAIIVIGIVLAVAPIDERFKQLVYILTLVAVVLFLLRVFGIFTAFGF